MSTTEKTDTYLPFVVHELFYLFSWSLALFVLMEFIKTGLVSNVYDLHIHLLTWVLLFGLTLYYRSVKSLSKNTFHKVIVSVFSVILCILFVAVIYLQFGLSIYTYAVSLIAIIAGYYLATAAY